MHHGIRATFHMNLWTILQDLTAEMSPTILRPILPTHSPRLLSARDLAVDMKTRDFRKHCQRHNRLGSECSLVNSTQSTHVSFNHWVTIGSYLPDNSCKGRPFNDCFNEERLFLVVISCCKMLLFAIIIRNQLPLLLFCKCIRDIAKITTSAIVSTSIQAQNTHLYNKQDPG